MADKFDYNEIINDEEFKKMLRLNDYEEVYELLRNYSLKISLKYSFNSDLQNKLRDRLFIYYLMVSTKIYRRRNVYEKVLIKIGSTLSEDILEYLLSQEIDMNYLGYDIYENATTLIDELALNINNPKIMQMILSKMDKVTKKHFGNEYYKLYTDLCRMNIVAGNIDKALEIFNSENYHLFNGINDKELAIKLSKNKEEIHINGEESDILLQIIKTVNNSEIDLEYKKEFLNKILYSKKIKLFNVSNLSIIKKILDNDKYQKYIYYLSNMLKLNKIILYGIKNNKKLVFYEPATQKSKQL